MTISPMSKTSDDHRSDDATLAALDSMATALDENARDFKVLSERLAQVRARRVRGDAWRDILSEEDDPGTIQLISRTLARLSLASGAVRKSVVVALRQEGASIPVIARLFGVTHQRVSNLLRRTGD
jgi:hypothetical protein